MRLRLVTLATAAVAGAAFAASSLMLPACAGDCWNEGHNCSSDYIEESGDDGECCPGLTCQESASGNLTCN